MKGFTLWDDSPFPSFVAQGQTYFQVFRGLRNGECSRICRSTFSPRRRERREPKNQE
jgi:hypothetical protein